MAASPIPNDASPLHLRRHLLQALGLVAFFRLACTYTTIDSPRPVYHCPLDGAGLTLRWTDENCYWSGSYAEAREKFVALGNRVREQVLLAQKKKNSGEGEVALDVVDVRSLSYDISRENYSDYLRSMKGNDLSSPQTVLPETDTIDALLLTLRIPGGDGEVAGGVGERERVFVIHSSGTHGIEGYVGSAVQVHFLHELYLRNEERFAKGLDAGGAIPLSGESVRKVLLIHAVNPYGMRHHRRTNENNVDLNRNVLSEDMWRDVRSRDPNFVGYVDMDSVLNPFAPVNSDGELFSWEDAARRGGFEGDVTRLRRQDQKVETAARRSDEPRPPQQPMSYSLGEPTGAISSWLEEQAAALGVFLRAVSAAAIMGYTSAKRTMVTSQYHKPSGIFYGGGAHNDNTWENSIFAVRHAIQEFGGFDFASPFMSSRALFIDVHTGLGKWGEYSILLKDPGSRMSASSPNNAIGDHRRGTLGNATSTYASAASCAQDLTVQLFEDSPMLTFTPDEQACKTGKAFVGVSNGDGSKWRINLVPGRGGRGTFTASVNDDLTGDIYSISPDADGVMTTVKRNQRDFEPEEPPPVNNAWIGKLISLLEEGGMGYGKSGDAGVSAGYDQSVGFLNDGVLCPPPNCFPLTQEFGTRPGIAVAVALILENRGHHLRERRYGHLTSWAFNPQRLSWRRKALRGGANLLRAMLDF